MKSSRTNRVGNVTPLAIIAGGYERSISGVENFSPNAISCVLCSAGLIPPGWRLDTPSPPQTTGVAITISETAIDAGTTAGADVSLDIAESFRFTMGCYSFTPAAVKAAIVSAFVSSLDSELG